MEGKKPQALEVIAQHTGYQYPIRSLPPASRGDFDGAEHAVDVFRIPVGAQLKFLRDLRPVGKELTNLLGGPCVFVFHTPEATQEYYSHLFPVVEGFEIRAGQGIVFDIPKPGALSRPVIRGNLSARLGAAA